MKFLNPSLKDFDTINKNAIMRADNVYVADNFNDRIQKF